MRYRLALFVPALAVFGTTQGQCPPPINDATTQLMQGYETYQSDPYDDGYGNITVGYGHKCADDQCSDVTDQGYSFPMSQDDANYLFQSDLQQFETCLNNALSATLNDNQYGALVSWTFNIGCGNMGSSTLVRRLNNGEDPDTVADEELPRWNKANGQVSNGLTARRQAEDNLFDTYSDYPALPC
ncbi:hypothetical protein FH972_026497 [Carpinus fangiana]|uniref:Lysozyme n=1 Tax=Carpinus fangiana TaxID=176857 RepID=A0A5N6L456_9ROSI|nr:hypothetical protein FH972_026497 [Carpinus fangiana]